MVWYPDSKPETRKPAGKSQKSGKSQKRAVTTVPAVEASDSTDQTTAAQNNSAVDALNKALQNGITSDDIALWAAVVTIIGDSLALIALLKAREESANGG